MGHTDQFGHFLVFCRNPCTGVTDKEDDIGFLDGNLSLLPDGNGNGVGIGNFNPARIDHHEAAVEPFCFGIKPVPRDTRRIFHNGDAAVRKNIE